MKSQDKPNSSPNLKEKWGKLEVECGKLETKYTEAGNTFLFNLITKGPQAMLKDAIKNSVEIIEKEIEIGGLPVKYKRLFASGFVYTHLRLAGTNFARLLMCKNVKFTIGNPIVTHISESQAKIGNPAAKST